MIKIGGGAYLIGLGLFTIWQTRRQRSVPAARRLPWTGRHSYPQALLANVLNPKAASIYLTLAPQFLTAQQVQVGPLLLLASVHVLVMALWLGLWSAVLLRGHRISQSHRFTTTVSRLGGAILVALGVRTVTT